MPQKRAAYKEIRKSRKRRLRNVGVASEVKTLIKNFNVLLSEKKFDEAKNSLKMVSSRIGKAVTKGIIRKNTASRKISRLSKNLAKASGVRKK